MHLEKQQNFLAAIRGRLAHACGPDLAQGLSFLLGQDPGVGLNLRLGFSRGGGVCTVNAV